MRSTTPPKNSELRHLRASSAIGSVHCISNIVGLLVGLSLAITSTLIGYLAGQLLLALCFVHAFVLLHEAGHQTLLRHRWQNTLVGHYSACLSLIPFASWRPIHARHHRYTGWQDLDATTATLIPRKLKPWERKVINFAWRTGTPLFSMLYRLQNYWHIPRINRFLKKRKLTIHITINVLALFSIYALLVVVVGFKSLLILVGPALLISLALEDVLLLSQHTHIPQNLSHGERVKTFSPLEQAQFSRSLRLPNWLSLALMRFDAHELHHMYPQVPGYHLHHIDYEPPNEVSWSTWIPEAKKMRGEDFLFQNRRDTGSSV